MSIDESKQCANQWIDDFLRVMNEGEPQNETSADDREADTSGGVRSDTGSPRATTGGQSQGTPAAVDTGNISGEPDDTGTVARTQ